MLRLFAFVLVGLTILLPLCQSAHAQGPYNKVELLFLQGYHHLGARTWGMGGVSVASVHDVTAILSNPARLCLLGKMEWYGEVGHRKHIKWLKSYTDDSCIRSAYPVFCGLSIRVKDRFSLGIAYRDHYTTWVDMGEEVIVVGGEGAFENVRIYSKASVRKYSFSVACRLSRHVRFGFAYDFNRARSVDHYGDLFQQGTETYIYSGHGHSVLLGLDARLPNGLTLGATFRPQYSIEGDERFLTDEPKVKFKDDFPSELKMGCSYNVGSRSTLAFDCQWTLWASIRDSDGDRYYENTIDIFNGLEIRMSDCVSIRCGHCTYADPWKDTMRIIDENQHFLSFGGTVRIGTLRFTIALMDSHLLQGEDVETTKVLLGFTYHLRKGGQ
jgi:hypothetical protein